MKSCNKNPNLLTIGGIAWIW